MFRFELLRKLVLTNQRVVFLKEEDIDHEIPIENIREVTLDSIGTGNPYLRMELKNGDAVSIFFHCIGMKMFLGAFYLIGKHKRLTKEWTDAINNQIMG
jgi:CRISPR/Cas system-associated endonuclease Cas1